MKKIILLLIPLLLIICGCSNKTYDEISYDKLNEMLKNEDSFILFIGSKTCSHCDAFKVTLNKVIKDYGVDVKYIDISKLDDDELSSLQGKFPFSGTPTTIFITDGKEKNTYNRIVGDKEYSKVVEVFKKNKYIKKSK